MVNPMGMVLEQAALAELFVLKRGRFLTLV